MNRIGNGHKINREKYTIGKSEETKREKGDKNISNRLEHTITQIFYHIKYI